MRADRVTRALPGLALLALVAGACGRIGYDPVAGGGGSGGAAGTAAGGRGGAAGAGTGGTGGGAAGAAGSAAGAGGSAGSAAGAGGTAGSAAGAGGAASGDGGIFVCAGESFGTHTYAFCDVPVDWATARAQCEARGMRLARVDDSAENAWIQQTAITDTPMGRRGGVWLGGYEPTTDGDWHWTDGDPFWSGGSSGTAVGGLFTSWERSEPNNVNGPEACLSMQLNDTTWFDWQCATPQYFVCEVY